MTKNLYVLAQWKLLEGTAIKQDKDRQAIRDGMDKLRAIRAEKVIPRDLMQIRTNLAGNAAIIECLWQDKAAPDEFRKEIAAALKIPKPVLETMEIKVFGAGDWDSSRAEALAYIEANRNEWETAEAKI